MTVAGVDDGDTAYLILTAVANNADPDYDGLNAIDIAVTNLDNDEPIFNMFMPLVSGE